MIDIAAIERSARAALPAGREIDGGDWVIRISGGATKRVNSANPVVQGARLAGVRSLAETLYAEAGLPPRFRLTPLAEPAADAMLAEAGSDTIDRSYTMLAPATGASIDPAVRLTPVSEAAHLAGFARASGWSAEQVAVHEGLLARLPATRVFATLGEGAGPLAFGVASVADDIAWLFDIAVAREARGRGMGRRLVGSLLRWAADQGAAQVGLQVLADNHPARALYDRLGFTDAYPYHYRIRTG